MAETAIDLDMLNELFDTQKNLDDVFNEDFFLDSSMLFGDNVTETSPENDSLDFQFEDDISINSENKFIHQKSRSIFYFVVPVIIEVAAISYSIIYFA